MGTLLLISIVICVVAMLLFCICEVVCKRKGKENNVNIGTLLVLIVFAMATAFWESIVLYVFFTLVLIAVSFSMCRYALKKEESVS